MLFWRVFSALARRGHGGSGPTGRLPAAPPGIRRTRHVNDKNRKQKNPKHFATSRLHLPPYFGGVQYSAFLTSARRNCFLHVCTRTGTRSVRRYPPMHIQPRLSLDLSRECVLLACASLFFLLLVSVQMSVGLSASVGKQVEEVEAMLKDAHGSDSTGHGGEGEGEGEGAGARRRRLKACRACEALKVQADMLKDAKRKEVCPASVCAIHLARCHAARSGQRVSAVDLGRDCLRARVCVIGLRSQKKSLSCETCERGCACVEGAVSTSRDADFGGQ